MTQDVPLLSVVIPVFNEEKTIGEVIDRVRNMGWANLEIIVVDDASTDGTRALLEGQLGVEVNRLLFHEKNLGKGAALRTGISESRGDLVVIQDADLEYSPEEIPKLAEPILQGKADAVFGSRFRGGETVRVLYFWHSVGNRFLTMLSNMFTNLNLTDMETCYKMVTGEIIRSIELKENRFGFEPEITSKLAQRKARIYEMGISYDGRTYAEGKKIGWKDGVRAIWVILKYGAKRSTQR